jgi:hypothetical protein
MTESATATAAAPSAPVVEQRRVPRLKTLLGGIIEFDDRKSTMDCTVRSLSAYGARIVLSEAFRVPDAFDLSIPHHDQVHRAKVIWRKGDCAGLALSDLAEHEEPPARHMTPRQMRRAHEKEMADALY